MKTSSLNRDTVFVPGGSGIEETATDCILDGKARIQNTKAYCGFFRTGFCLSDSILNTCYEIWE